MNAGGAETFLMKIYRAVDRTKYQFDFVVATNEKCFYDEEIISLGGKIFHILPKSSGMLRNFFSIKSIVKKNGYKSVLRISQHSLSALELLAAWMGGAKKRGFRSSNSNTTTGSKKSLFLHNFFKFMPKLFANVRFAPSSEAAIYMFGKRMVKNKKVQIIPNGLDLSVYKFDFRERERVRKEFQIDNRFVVGHIGRFNQQKNHPFLIKVFIEIKKIKPSSVLLLIGTGENENQIRQDVINYGLQNSVIFCGIRADIPALLSSMDVFVFPSFYEGLPNTVIEAQACRLPCVISDSITREARITNIVRYMSLYDTPEEWAKAALSFDKQRVDTYMDFVTHNYDIYNSAKSFVELLFDNK